jgi:hypothetical protein
MWMRRYVIKAVVAGAVFAVLSVNGAQKPAEKETWAKNKAADAAALNRLIQKLGSDTFDEREAAQQQLYALGEKDLPALRAASKNSNDAEVRRRLADAITTIETRFTKDPFDFVERVGGRVVTVDSAEPVKSGKAVTEDLSVILIDAKIGDGDLHRLKELGKVKIVVLAGTKVTDRGLPVLQSLAGLRSVNLDGTAVTDAGLAHLKALSNLEELSLRRTKVQGMGLDHLKDLKGFWYLELTGCAVTDADLVHVVALPHLESLSLGGTKVTDAGLARLPALSELKNLYLENTGVTDAGLAHLARVKKLRGVGLAGTRVTEEGIEGLKKVHSKLIILGERRPNK